MITNPYESPSPPRHDNPQSLLRPLFLLVLAMMVTLMFATINAIEEDFPTHAFTIKVVLGAGLSQVPGILLAMILWRRQARAITLLLVPAYVIAVTGAVVYALYAFNGKADSLNSAAHMHVIMFPLLHCVFAALLYLVFGIPVVLITIFRASR